MMMTVRKSEVRRLAAAHNRAEIQHAPEMIFATEIAIIIGRMLFPDGRLESLIIEYEQAFAEASGDQNSTLRIRDAIIEIGVVVSAGLEKLNGIKPFKRFCGDDLPSQKGTFVKVSEPTGHRFMSQILQRDIEIDIPQKGEEPQEHYSKRAMAGVLFAGDLRDNSGQTSVQSIADGVWSLDLLNIVRDGSAKNSALRFSLSVIGRELMLDVSEKAEIYSTAAEKSLIEKRPSIEQKIRQRFIVKVNEMAKLFSKSAAAFILISSASFFGFSISNAEASQNFSSIKLDNFPLKSKAMETFGYSGFWGKSDFADWVASTESMLGGSSRTAPESTMALCVKDDFEDTMIEDRFPGGTKISAEGMAGGSGKVLAPMNISAEGMAGGSGKVLAPSAKMEIGCLDFDEMFRAAQVFHPVSQ